MGCIYIIKSRDLSLHDIYVGSCKDFRSRMRKHKSNCYNENGPKYHYKLYEFIRANGGWDNFLMEELCKCDVERLNQVEQEYIDKLNPSLNSKRALGIDYERRKEYNKEWYEKNKEYQKEFMKERYKNNKDIMLQKQKEYYHNNKEYRKEYAKEWRENNKEYQKEYREKYKDKISEKITCECGSIHRRGGKERHLRTNKHKSFIENKKS